MASNKLGVISLAALVVSAMIGGGVYNLPQNMAQNSSAGAIIIAWIITGIGMWFSGQHLQYPGRCQAGNDCGHLWLWAIGLWSFYRFFDRLGVLDLLIVVPMSAMLCC